jgi:hypothetical protein
MFGIKTMAWDGAERLQMESFVGLALVRSDVTRIFWSYLAIQSRSDAVSP